MRFLFVSLGFFLAFAPVSGEDDVVMQAMQDELTRSMTELQLQNLEKPYFIAYRVSESKGMSVSSSFGALLSSFEGRIRRLTVEVRVGDYEFDNTNFRSQGSRFRGTAQLPLDDDYQEMRRQMWLATDAAYKQALEDLSEKRAALQNRTQSENIADFSNEEPVSTVEEFKDVEIELQEAQNLVRELSNVFKDFPEILTSSVRLRTDNNTTRYLNSEGTSYIRTTPLLAFTAVAGTQAPDGIPLEDFVAAYGRSLKDIPNKKNLRSEIKDMGDRLMSQRLVPMEASYNGPVLFEGQAAAEVFTQGFAANLLASRSAPTGGRGGRRGGGLRRTTGGLG